MDATLRELLEKQGYRIVGRHSAVKVCHWLKESLLRGRACYKEQFYGIKSHRCLQMTPSVAWCQHRCIFCWRPVERSLGPFLDTPLDGPEEIVEGSIALQRELLSGYWGEKGRVRPELVAEAHDPKHAAISLAGEPTNYPHLQELIEGFHRRGMTTFLVTNGQNPGALEEIEPTQLYLSLIAPDRELYRRVSRPLLGDGWERLQESLDIFSGKKGKKVIRITLVRGYNLEVPRRFAPLIERADPDFVEAKGYVHVGYSRRRLERRDMPSYDEVMAFAQALGGEAGYRVRESARDSKVALLERA